MIQKRGNETSIEEVILRNTGYKTIEEFNNSNKDYYIKDLDKATDRIKDAIAKNIPITVVIPDDYDVDGVTTSGIVLMTLKQMGANVRVRLPHSFSEGFNLSTKTVEEIDTGLLITVYDGVVELEAVQKEKDKELEVSNFNKINLKEIIEKSKKDGKILQDVIDKNGINIDFIKKHFNELPEDTKEEILKNDAYKEILDSIPFDNDTKNIGRD